MEKFLNFPIFCISAEIRVKIHFFFNLRQVSTFTYAVDTKMCKPNGYESNFLSYGLLLYLGTITSFTS